ncbi:MAG: cobalamin-independent methionine synthase II family protein [Candidatus Binataceae bacterium]|nr:cobalamin-independent methionine synthase II family protein [Candidatus Binataceae bacterium]
MEHSAQRILTTHCGSLPRPKGLLDLMKAKLTGNSYDKEAYARATRSAVAEIVRQQVSCGIDLISDGEQGKPGFFTYINERLTGFEPRVGNSLAQFADEMAAFPEYYEEYFGRAMTGGTIAPVTPMVCTGSVTYRGKIALHEDLENLLATGAKPTAMFMPAVAPSGAGRNEYYPSEEAYLYAVAEAMRTEYLAIADAGLTVQVDDPFLSDIFGDASLTAVERRKKAEKYVEAINHALRGVPAEQVRFHTCYGINEGPRLHDAALKDIAPIMLKVKAQAYSFEAANSRHEHEYHLWEDLRLPEGKILIPGVVTHASNIVEHPELIAERIVRYARLVGRENVIAGTDCGFSSQATYKPEVHPTVVWAKFRAMAEGAQLATRQLWP